MMTDKKPASPAAEPKVSQAKPTQPQPIDDRGRVLDANGLPTNGPARARAIEEKR